METKETMKTILNDQKFILSCIQDMFENHQGPYDVLESTECELESLIDCFESDYCNDKGDIIEGPSNETMLEFVADFTIAMESFKNTFVFKSPLYVIERELAILVFLMKEKCQKYREIIESLLKEIEGVEE